MKKVKEGGTCLWMDSHIKSLLENREDMKAFKVSLLSCYGNTHVLQYVSQPRLRLGSVSNHRVGIVTRPSRSGKAWSLAGLCLLALVRLSLFSSPLSDSEFTLSLQFCFTYLFILHNLNYFCGPTSEMCSIFKKIRTHWTTVDV